MPTQIEGAQLGERETAFQSAEYVPIDAPANATILIAFVVQRKTGFLQRRQIATNRACGDVELAGEPVNRGAMTRRLERMQHAPLADDLLISRHDSSYRGLSAFFQSAQFPAAITVGRAGRASGGAVGALDTPGFDL